MIVPMNARVVCVVQLVWIEAEQEVNFVSRPRLRLIDLVVLNERLGKMTDRGEVRSLVDDGCMERAPRVLIHEAELPLPPKRLLFTENRELVL